MAEGSAARLSCPACDRHYRFKPELAGRKAKCKCGAVLRMPTNATSPIELLDGGAAASSSTAEPKATPPAPANPPPEINVAPSNDAMSIPVEGDDPLTGGIEGDTFDAAGTPADSAEDETAGGNPLDANFKNAPGNVDSYDLNIDLEPTESPAAPPAADEDEDILVPAAGAAAPTAAKGACPSCGQHIKSGAVICLNCGFNIKEGKKLTTEVDEVTDQPTKPSTPGAIPPMGMNATPPPRVSTADDASDHMMQEFYGPLALLVGALLLIALDTFLLAGMAYDTHDYLTPYSIAGDMVIKGVRLVITVPFLIAGVVTIALMFGSELGTLHTAILKLAGMVLMLVGFGEVVNSLADIVTGGYGGIAIYGTMALNFGVFYGLAAWLLEAENVEVIILYLFVYFLPAILMVFIGAAVLSMFGL